MPLDGWRWLCHDCMVTKLDEWLNDTDTLGHAFFKMQLDNLKPWSAQISYIFFNDRHWKKSKFLESIKKLITSLSDTTQLKKLRSRWKLIIINWKHTDHSYPDCSHRFSLHFLVPCPFPSQTHPHYLTLPLAFDVSILLQQARHQSYSERGKIG